MSRADDVREIEGGADERSRHESKLDGVGDPTYFRRREAPRALESRNDGRSTEPRRHAQQLGDGKERKNTPAPRVYGSCHRQDLQDFQDVHD